MKGSEVQRTESPFLPSSIASHLRGGSLTSLVVIQVVLRKGQLDCRERGRRRGEDGALLVALVLVVDAVVGNARALLEVESEIVGLLASDVALVVALRDVDAIGLTVRAGSNRVVGARVDGEGGLDVEVDEGVVGRAGKLVLGDDVGDRRALVVTMSRLAGGDGHDGDREEESGNCGEEHGG